MTSTPDAPLQSRMVDDKSPKCIPFILERLKAHQASSEGAKRPFIIGLNGVQGVGKTTLVRALAETLQEREHLQTLVISIDDFYLRHNDQLALATAHPDNALVQVRGEPGTHDVALLRDVFRSLCTGQPTLIPSYDKGAFDGLGDRLPESRWTAVNQEGQPKVQVVLLEGWCVGFRSISHEAIEAKWMAPSRTLALHKLEDLCFVNDQLRGYDIITDLFDAFIHIDAEDTEFVYDWRLQQEQQMRMERGTGMTDEQVVKFVDAYYPAYELFSDGVRDGIFLNRKGHQLRLIVGKDRMVIDKIVI
ncbi:P-loop containing nucleoside triphosphate hydrolase protein [Cryphonectria parasitica EP155]|uniref:P-loop containing nucleoside triphosphate hydrolase protein n=1 Tax=Cryphonectria parasitica (strain ATCC 38755 / EP155) TaxID=660469 RepID=A0A9P4Y631_CRYP1|nr:P-loop containing nucleoside triphosphate hydrolase protein [Cryphonectria parasitica EP155]KAF3767398.1 P-loop containing nucleoside triphosphate hydrolase protein [Cryphonectria parasitica EP155]